MRCPDDEKFARYAEGKLSGGERVEFLDHIRECPECAALYAVTYMDITNLKSNVREGADKTCVEQGEQKQRSASWIANWDESTNECPDEESISSLAEGKLSKNQREALLKHIAVCKTCSVEFYYLRKLKFSEKPAKKVSAKKRNILQLIALAAMITLVVGLTGYNVFDKKAENNIADMGSASHQYDRNRILTEEMLPAAAPFMVPEIDQNLALKADEQVSFANSKPIPTMGQENATGGVKAAPKAKVTQEMERAANDEIVYEVIYNGHEGDIREIVRLIRLIAGIDEESAANIAKSSSTVIIKCSSLEKAQNIKNELELAGAKIEIKNTRR